MTPNPIDHTTIDPPALLTPHTVATVLLVSQRTVVDWCVKNLLMGVKTPGGHWRIPFERLMAILAMTPQYRSFLPWVLRPRICRDRKTALRQIRRALAWEKHVNPTLYEMEYAGIPLADFDSYAKKYRDLLSPYALPAPEPEEADATSPAQEDMETE